MDTSASQHLPTFPSEDLLRRTVANLLTKMPGHRNVQITHGVLEKGKDIIFSVQTGFLQVDHCACVVKNTPISGSSSSDKGVFSVLTQVRQAFDSTFLDYNGKEAHVNSCFLICPHEISQITLTIIKDELTAFRGRLRIIDGSQLFGLLQQYYPDYKVDEFVYKTQLADFRQDLTHDRALERLAFGSLREEVNRNTQNVYVQPSFLLSLKFWTVDTALISSLIPNVPLLLSERTLGARIVPFEAISSIRSAREQCNVQMSAFVKVELLDRTLLDELLDRYENLAEVIRAGQRLQTRVNLPGNDNLIDGYSIDERAAISVERSLKLIWDSLGFLSSTVNHALDQLEGELSHTVKLPICLDMKSVAKALWLSDYCLYNPCRFLRSDKSLVLTVEKDAFHKSGVSVFIVGPAGYGKTSFCKWHTLEDDKLFSAGIHSWIAVYIPLHHLTRRELLDIASKVRLQADLTAELFQRSTRTQYGYRIYLDGLDEVVDQSCRSSVLQLIRENRPLGRPTAYVLTSRDHLVSKLTMGIPRVSINPLSASGVEELARLWLSPEHAREFIRQLNHTSGLVELARVPLLCTLAILVFRRTLSLPANSLKLYESFIDLLCSGWDLAKGVQSRSTMTAEFKILVLRKLAAHAQEHESKSFVHDDIVAVLDRINARAPVDVEILVDELVSDGVIQKVGNTYEFRHLSFQEYLAALDLFSQPSRRKAELRLQKYLGGNNWWRGVFEFFVLMASDPDATVKWIESVSSEVFPTRPLEVQRVIAHLESVANGAFERN